MLLLYTFSDLPAALLPLAELKADFHKTTRKHFMLLTA